jgi:hypothetical protein
MPLPEQKKKLLKAKIAVALHDELGRVPKKEEIETGFSYGKSDVQSSPGAPLQTTGAKEKWPVSNLLIH